MLLHLEELHLQESLDKYNQENVLVTAHKSNSETFTLKVGHLTVKTTRQLF